MALGEFNGHSEDSAVLLMWHELKRLTPIVESVNNWRWWMMGGMAALGAIGVANLAILIGGKGG